METRFHVVFERMRMLLHMHADGRTDRRTDRESDTHAHIHACMTDGQTESQTRILYTPHLIFLINGALLVTTALLVVQGLQSLVVLCFLQSLVVHGFFR